MKWIYLTGRIPSTPNKILRKAHRKLKRKLRWQMFKAGVKSIFQPKKAQKNPLGTQDTALIVLVILAIIIPPIAVLLYEGGLTPRFWLSLLLTILGYLPGIIYALLVVTDTI